MEVAFKLDKVFTELEKIGLNDPGLEKNIRETTLRTWNEQGYPVKRRFGNNEVEFKVFLYIDKDNQLRLDGYDVMMPRNFEKINHLERNGIDSRDLEMKLSVMDWEFAKPTPKNGLLEIPFELFDLLANLDAFSNRSQDVDPVSFIHSQKVIYQLMLKYLPGTPVQRKIEALNPVFEALFKQSIPFPAELYASIPGKQADDPELLRLLSKELFENENQKTFIMNLNNLEDLRDEMKKLGFSDALVTKMEEHMKNDDPNFKLYDQVKAGRGQVDITLHFKQSGQSDFYYLNRLEAVHNQAKPLEEGQRYMVITKTAEGEKNPVRKMENLAEAIDYFKKQNGNAELAAGKDAGNKTMLANMEAGKVNYVSREFKRDFYSPPLPQTFWLDHGKGFSREQAANLVQGRSVYRDDLLSREGAPYKAWMQLDTEKERDRNNNLTFRQFTDAYGYDVKALLDEYKIKEMEDPKKAEALETSLMNGNRPMVTVEKDGQETKVFLETAVRYGKLNFYAENGKPEKRELFQKETGLEMSHVFSKKAEKDNSKEVSQGQGMGM